MQPSLPNQPSRTTRPPSPPLTQAQNRSNPYDNWPGTQPIDNKSDRSDGNVQGRHEQRGRGYASHEGSGGGTTDIYLPDMRPTSSAYGEENGSTVRPSARATYYEDDVISSPERTTFEDRPGRESAKKQMGKHASRTPQKKSRVTSATSVYQGRESAMPRVQSGLPGRESVYDSSAYFKSQARESNYARGTATYSVAALDRFSSLPLAGASSTLFPGDERDLWPAPLQASNTARTRDSTYDNPISPFTKPGEARRSLRKSEDRYEKTAMPLATTSTRSLPPSKPESRRSTRISDERYDRIAARAAATSISNPPISERTLPPRSTSVTTLESTPRTSHSRDSLHRSQGSRSRVSRASSTRERSRAHGGARARPRIVFICKGDQFKLHTQTGHKILTPTQKWHERHPQVKPRIRDDDRQTIMRYAMYLSKKMHWAGREVEVEVKTSSLEHNSVEWVQRGHYDKTWI